MVTSEKKMLFLTQMSGTLLGQESCRQFLPDHALCSVHTDCTLGVIHLFQYISKHSKVMGCLDFKENSTPNNGAAVIVKSMLGTPVLCGLNS